MFDVYWEGWPSGLRRTPGKRVGVNAPPGFESPSLRHVFTVQSILHTCQLPTPARLARPQPSVHIHGLHFFLTAVQQPIHCNKIGRAFWQLDAHHIG